jgi:hypothetical protein
MFEKSLQKQLTDALSKYFRKIEIDPTSKQIIPGGNSIVNPYQIAVAHSKLYSQALL